MSEALRCFTYLVETVPLWIKDLEQLEEKIKGRHNGVERVPVPLASTVRRSGSNESIRPGQLNGGSSFMETLSAPRPEATTHAQTTKQIFFNKRKRKTESLWTSLSTPSKYRSRSSMTIYYDSAIQKGFEDLVRDIGTGRNHTRKARIAARMEALTSSSMSGDDREDINVLSARNMRSGPYSGQGHAIARDLRSARGLSLRSDPSTDGFDGMACNACTLADQALDRAQTFCEQGAHQFLRDGDCDEETTGAKENFLAIMIVSEKEIERIKKFEQARSRAREVEKRREHDRQQRESLEIHPGLMSSIGSGSLMEADDDDDGENEFDDSSVLSSPFLRYRIAART